MKFIVGLLLALSAQTILGVPHKRENIVKRQIACPSDWIPLYEESACFKVIRKTENWDSAKGSCDAIGSEASGEQWIGRLAEPRDAETTHFIHEKVINPSGVGQVWIGAKASGDGGKFTWSTNARFIGNDTLDISPGVGECLSIYAGERLKFDSHNCDRTSMPYVCELTPEDLTFCNDQPHLAVANTLPVEGYFSRFEGNQVKLKCKIGYKQAKDLPVYGVCERLNGVLKWTDCGGNCELIEPYCKGEPASGIQNYEKISRSAYLSRLGDQARILCKKGYSSGKKILLSICKEKTETEGEWSADGNCNLIENYCHGSPASVVPNSDPTRPYHGEWILGQVVDVTCKTGYRSTFGEVVKVRCHAQTYEKGLWIKVKGECEEIKDYCDDKPYLSFKNTVPPPVDGYKRTYLSLVNMECRAGYIATEGYTMKAVCWSNRKWKSLETCDAIPNYCPPPPWPHVPLVVIVDQEISTVVGSEVALQCVPGYEPAIHGRFHARCIAVKPNHGAWHINSFCKIKDIYCPVDALWAKFTGVVKYSEQKISTQLGSKVTVKCMNGYVAGQRMTAIDNVCRAKDLQVGDWISTFVDCFKIKRFCDDHPEKAVKNVNLPSNPPQEAEIDDVVDLTCKKGYAPSSGNVVKVQCIYRETYEGDWKTSQTCNEIDPYCPDHVEDYVPHSLTMKSGSYRRTIGSEAILQCKKGYLAVPANWNAVRREWTDTTVKARCSESEEKVGVWVAVDSYYCECDEKIKEVYQEMEEEAAGVKQKTMDELKAEGPTGVNRLLQTYLSGGKLTRNEEHYLQNILGGQKVESGEAFQGGGGASFGSAKYSGGAAPIPGTGGEAGSFRDAALAMLKEKGAGGRGAMGHGGQAGDYNALGSTLKKRSKST